MTPLLPAGETRGRRDHRLPLASGTHITHYEIIAPIGAGGMGEVYKAWDSSLNRNVALKILPPEKIATPDMLRRFVREARAVSALNHPNIVTVYEIGHAEVDTTRVDFIAMELIEGETLRSLLSRSVATPNALNYLAQIADGLAKAHSAGILHRDLKPENVMIASDGFAKIVDFGLAKSVQPDVDAAIDSATVTAPGAVMGTIGYMSPEQLRGAAVDHRSDIFSFGCILYEFLTRRRPFQGVSDIDTFHKILYEPPLEIGDANPPIGDTLRRVTFKCLSKDPEERYQSAKEIAIDLREIKREYESGAPVLAEPGSLKSPRRRSHWLWITASFLILATVAWIWTRRTAGDTTAVQGSLQSMSIERLPATSNVRLAAISPDGRYLAHVETTPPGDTLLVRQVATGSEIQVAPADGEPYDELSFSEDGEYIRYVHRGALRQSPALGGSAKILVDRFSGAISFSPDGKRFAFVREGNVFVASSDGSDERRIANATNNDRYETPAWSPRGDVIACTRLSQRRIDRGDRSIDILNVEDVDAEPPQTVMKLGEPWYHIGALTWLPDASGIVVSATRQALIEKQLYEITYPAGRTTRLTNDLFEYEGTSITTDGKVLVSRQTDKRSSIWLFDPEHPDKARRIIEGIGFIRHLAALPDGGVLYGASSGGNSDIWHAAIDGTRRVRLTDDPAMDLMPSASPDGQTIAFISDRSGQLTIWIMGADGTHQRQLTTEGRDARPRFSPDGSWLVYSTKGTKRAALHRIAVSEGKPSTLSTSWFRVPAVSPDGKYVAALSEDWRLGVVSASDGSPVRAFEERSTSLNSAAAGGELRWTKDSSAIAFARQGVVYLQNLAGGPPQKIADVRPDEIVSFDWSTDGKSLLLARVSNQHALVQLKNFR
ncbi:MAG TPA: protein kinase [Gemmatimonadaceae bacterium]|nr:protein kinase [Gemmatimonadaceae bacterium]